jgi:hypothetical protein
MNSINVISPYKHYGMWVFDDPRVGLVQEPFVAGADIMMECLVSDIPDAAKGFILVFASTPFPGHQHRLDWERTDTDGGNWYCWKEFKIEGWLCPALFKYFTEAPKHIYVQARQRTD